MTNNKNPKEYARQYVDSPSEDTDVVGYSPSIDYSFDRINWKHYTVGNDITIPTDGKVYLRGNNDYFSVYDYDNYDDVLYYHNFVFERHIIC